MRTSCLYGGCEWSGLASVGADAASLSQPRSAHPPASREGPAFGLTLTNKQKKQRHKVPAATRPPPKGKIFGKRQQFTKIF